MLKMFEKMMGFSPCHSQSYEKLEIPNLKPNTEVPR